MSTEEIFKEISKNDEFLSTYIYNPTERIRVAVELEILKALNELLAKTKGGKS